jgi:DNA-directed RNA polymerase beta subunit
MSRSTSACATATWRRRKNAREYINSIFSEERYDLSRVGRYRFNQRFNKSLDEKELTRKTLSLDDLVTVSTMCSSSRTTRGMEDNIDHLGSAACAT